MAMKFSKSLASMLLSKPFHQVQPLGNAEFGFQPEPYLKTFFRGHHQTYAIHLNTLFHTGMMWCNQVTPTPVVQAECVSRVVWQAITSDSALKCRRYHVILDP